MCSLLQELFYLTVIYVYITEVNEKADQLTLKIALTRWEGTEKECCRLAVLAFATSKPISFTFAGQRMKRFTLLLSLGGMASALIYSVLRLASEHFHA